MLLALSQSLLLLLFIFPHSTTPSFSIVCFVVSSILSEGHNSVSRYIKAYLRHIYPDLFEEAVM